MKNTGLKLLFYGEKQLFGSMLIGWRLDTMESINKRGGDSLLAVFIGNRHSFQQFIFCLDHNTVTGRKSEGCKNSVAAGSVRDPDPNILHSTIGNET